MGQYDDIIHLPHHQSARRAHMPLRDRAAQFAPFAALTGFGAMVGETARRTGSRIELSDSRKEELDAVLREAAAHIETQPLAELSFFVEDGRKDGGTYVTKTGNIRKIDRIAHTVELTDGTLIAFDDLFEMEMLESWNTTK